MPQTAEATGSSFQAHMADIFISYARSTEAQAHHIAELLRRAGYDVWRDDALPAHLPYADVIETELRVAKAVVVVWSADGVKSQWVRAEADVARSAGTLVQLKVDETPLPLPFNQIQCAQLTGWNGAADAPGWAKVLASVEALVHGPGAPKPFDPPEQRPSHARRPPRPPPSRPSSCRPSPISAALTHRTSLPKGCAKTLSRRCHAMPA